jgi:hypothetical protein
MSYEDKLFTVRKIVDKVIATKEQVTICGLIPVYEPIVSEQYVGLHAKHWHGYGINQPFEITFPLPEPDDKRTRGYSKQFLQSMMM